MSKIRLGIDKIVLDTKSYLLENYLITISRKKMDRGTIQLFLDDLRMTYNVIFSFFSFFQKGETSWY